MCNCKEKMETAILNHFKKTKPNSKDHKISLKAVSVAVDKPLPKWWAYPDTNRFAPGISEIKIIA